MKKFVMVAALAALAGCSQQAEKAAEAEAAPAEAAAPAVVDAASLAGEYDVKMADGKMGRTRINADGTFVDTAPDGKEVKGKVAIKDGKECFDDDGDEAEVCWTSAKPGADGSFTSTNDKGETVTVMPVKK
jgi:aconitase A